MITNILSRKLEDVRGQKAVKEAVRTRRLWAPTIMMDPITMMPITRSQTRAQEPTYNPEPTAPPRRRIEVRIP